MRLVIDAPAYTTAADAFTTANQVAAIQHDSLVGKLGSFFAMAGDDSTSAQFAAAYDGAAAEAVAALADLVPAFANLGRLAGRSAANHRAANAQSIIAGTIVFDGTWLPGGEVVSVLPATPPSSLGGDPATFSDKENWILDRIEGFVWPSADTDRLRDAAHVWRAAADSLDGLRDHCSNAVCALETQRSPEIPIALAATGELAATIGEVAGQIAALARSCEEYAAEVDARREEIRALLREILQMVVEGLVVSAAIGLITGGAGAIAGTSAVVARVAAQAPRFAAILAALRAAVTTSTAYLRTTHAALRASRMRTAKFVNVRLGMRNEFGQVRWTREPKGWLWRHERSRSHTIDTHVGKSDRAILKRLDDEPDLTGSSSFPNLATAERSVGSILDARQSSVAEWLAGRRPSLKLDGHVDWIAGRHAYPGGTVNDVSGVRVILVRDTTMPDGFRILTSYPTP